MIAERSLQKLWHPCSQMKDYELFKPLIVRKARGSYIELDNGRKIIDAISSWWCKSLGHNHPQLKSALLTQLDKFEHVIFANTTHEIILELAEKLIALTKTLTKAFFAGDGSCAVEVAMKMSLHSRQIQHQPKRRRFLALSNGYHGETAGALSVSDVGLYRNPYTAMLFAVDYITPVYVSGPEDPLWADIGERWPAIEKQLDLLAPEVTAIIVEPIVQGAGNMQVYSADFLKRLRAWTIAHDVHLIADEIMTGLYRTGPAFACEHAGIEPDLLCLGKGLTSGWLPFSAVLVKEEIYALFYADYVTGKNFLHSHTYCGNALGASVALATLTVMEQENIAAKARAMQPVLKNNMQFVAEKTGRLTQIRGIGAIAAADIIIDNPSQRAGFAVYQKAVKLGALLRPLGNTLYWLPPLNTGLATLTELKEITQASLYYSSMSNNFEHTG
jgi:adenosylmethionine---8-amino-7-oxononanoate aminotransferase